MQGVTTLKKKKPTNTHTHTNTELTVPTDSPELRRTEDCAAVRCCLTKAKQDFTFKLDRKQLLHLWQAHIFKKYKKYSSAFIKYFISLLKSTDFFIIIIIFVSPSLLLSLVNNHICCRNVLLVIQGIWSWSPDGSDNESVLGLHYGEWCARAGNITPLVPCL